MSLILIAVATLAATLGCAAAAPPEAQRWPADCPSAEVYRRALLKCKEEGRDAGSLSVYERCAREQDIRCGLATALDAGTGR